MIATVFDPDKMARKPFVSVRESRVEFERLVEEEKQAIADHQVTLVLSGLSTDDQSFYSAPLTLQTHSTIPLSTD